MGGRRPAGQVPLINTIAGDKLHQEREVQAEASPNALGGTSSGVQSLTTSGQGILARRSGRISTCRHWETK